MTTSRPLALAAFALTTALTMSSCSSDEKPAEAQETASPSPSTDASAPTVPSDWQSVALDGVAEVSVPADWTVKSTTDALDTLEAPKDAIGFPPGTATVNVGNLGGGDQGEELEWMANRQIKTNYAHYSPNRLPDKSINGTDFYRLQFESESEWFDLYGTVTPDAEYSIVFLWRFDKTISRKKAEAIWSPVMPTFKML